MFHSGGVIEAQLLHNLVSQLAKQLQLLLNIFYYLLSESPNSSTLWAAAR